MPSPHGRIVWAEDDPADRRLYQEVLEQEGFADLVRFVRDGREFLEAVQSSPPNLGVLDMRMPVLDGIQTVSALRTESIGANLPIIMLSSSENPTLRAACGRLGVLDCWTKPSGLDQIVKTIRKIVMLADAAHAASKESDGVKLNRGPRLGPKTAGG